MSYNYKLFYVHPVSSMGSHSIWYALTVPHISECWPSDGPTIRQKVATIYTEWHKKPGTFEKTQQKLKKSKKKNLLMQTEPLQLAF